MSEIHIGKKIKDVCRKAGFTVEAFGERIGMSRGGVNKVFAKEILDTDLLHKISKVLNHDFFVYFSQELDLAVEPKGNFGYATKDDFAEVIRLLKKMDARIDQLEEGGKKEKKSSTKKDYREKKHKG